MTDFLKTLYAYGVLSHISFFINGCKVTKKREQNKKNILFFAEKGIKRETNFLNFFLETNFLRSTSGRLLPKGRKNCP